MKNKRLITLAFTALALTNLVFADNIALGDIDKGQTYYKYLISPHLNYSGSTFTKKYTTKEWEILFSNNAKEFFEKFKLPDDKFDKDVLSHIKAFAIYYAKDSDVKATCSN